MAVNPELLKKAREAGSKLAELEHQGQLARAEYHAVIRRIHLAGGSLREIARELELSHQRVQQMVGSAGGSWWQRVWRPRSLTGNLACTFCARSQEKLNRLIAGPKVYICDACVTKAERSMSGSAPVAPVPFVRAGEGSRSLCSFCSKSKSKHRPLLTGPNGNICGECLNVCRQILTDSGV